MQLQKYIMKKHCVTAMGLSIKDNKVGKKLEWTSHIERYFNLIRHFIEM